MGYYKVNDKSIKFIFEQYFEKVKKRAKEIQRLTIDAGADSAYVDHRRIGAFVFKDIPDDLLWKPSKYFKGAWVPTHKTSIGRDLLIIINEISAEIPKKDWLSVIHYGESTKGCYFGENQVSFSPGVIYSNNNEVLLSTSEWVDPLWDRSKLSQGAIEEITGEEYRALKDAPKVQ